MKDKIRKREMKKLLLRFKHGGEAQWFVVVLDRTQKKRKQGKKALKREAGKVAKRKRNDIS